MSLSPASQPCDAVSIAPGVKRGDNTATGPTGLTAGFTFIDQGYLFASEAQVSCSEHANDAATDDNAIGHLDYLVDSYDLPIMSKICNLCIRILAEIRQ